MTGYTDLVKSLRCKRDDCEGCDLAFFDKDEGWMCQFAAKDDDAADAIEALETEIRESMQKCAECGDANMPKRGKWIHVEGDEPWEWRCTACHKIAEGLGEFRFCPNCGTRMRGEVNERG